MYDMTLGLGMDIHDIWHLLSVNFFIVSEIVEMQCFDAKLHRWRREQIDVLCLKARANIHSPTLSCRNTCVHKTCLSMTMQESSVRVCCFAYGDPVVAL